MACHTITESAKLAGVSRRTIQRYVKQGKLSAKSNSNGNPEIDTSELLRVFPDLSHPQDQNLSQAVAANVTPSNIEQLLADMMQEIKALRAEVSELKRLEFKPEPIKSKGYSSDLDYIPKFGE
jgi:predicted site-specific integrase-resolvase